MNVIDARWIDTSSGMFIDITTVRKDDEARKRGRLSALICKDGHQYDVCVLKYLADCNDLKIDCIEGERHFPSAR